MRDEALVRNLWAHLQAELTKLDNTESRLLSYSHANYITVTKTLYDARLKILSMMERLAMGDVADPAEVAKAKTSWDKINSGEGP